MFTHLIVIFSEGSFSDLALSCCRLFWNAWKIHEKAIKMFQPKKSALSAIKKPTQMCVHILHQQLTVS